MQDAFTVVISAAGLGTRLGLNRPKALVEIDGKPLLVRQLEMLHDVEDIIVVAGFQAHAVLEVVGDLRPDALVCFNHEYASTGTAASVAKAAQVTREWVISLDGDLLVEAGDFRQFVAWDGPCLGITTVRSKTPVYAQLGEDFVVTKLSQANPTTWEWSGLARIPRSVALNLGRAHVFEVLSAHLPMPAREVDCVEIDEIEDIEAAEEWVRKNERHDDDSDAAQY